MSSYNYENFVSLNLLLEITHNRLKWHDITLKIQHEVTIVAIFFFFHVHQLFLMFNEMGLFIKVSTKCRRNDTLIFVVTI